MMNILFFILCLITCAATHIVNGIQIKPPEDLELETQLKLITKPSIKSIHTKFGYIIDCIDITKQPAFDHPLLKNHKLQRKPSFHKSTRERNMGNSPTKSVFGGLEKGTCPDGTVPIRRTTKDDLIRSKSLLNDHILTESNSFRSYTTEVAAKSSEGPFYGVSGSNSVYNPKVYTEDQMTLSQLWVRNGPVDGPPDDAIYVGWHVAPSALYGGDEATHLFTLWTTDKSGTPTGCYNLQCARFVQVSDRVFPGARFENTSIYGGVMIETSLALSKDASSKNWWLLSGGDPIGYFPEDLFSNMSSAYQVGWGGKIYSPVTSPNPPMGSGYLPDYNLNHACYFRNVTYQKQLIADYIKPNSSQIEIFNNVKPTCYDVKFYEIPGPIGHSLEFGGPGGNCES